MTTRFKPSPNPRGCCNPYDTYCTYGIIAARILLDEDRIQKMHLSSRFKSPNHLAYIINLTTVSIEAIYLLQASVSRIMRPTYA
jgi:hypothetical protein